MDGEGVKQSADFVSWVYSHAGSKLNYSYVPSLMAHMQSSGHWKGNHDPKPGDIVIFGPATVKCGHEEVVHDFPAGGWRIKETAEGVSHTIVNGQILLEDKKHTGALPGRLVRGAQVAPA